MTIVDRVNPDARCCCNCVYWRRHYIRIEGSINRMFWALDTGHCANPQRRMPRTKPKDTCDRYVKKGDEIDARGKEADVQRP